MTVKQWVGVVVVVVIVAVGALSGGGCGNANDDCMKLYDDRIGHDEADNAFWSELQDCAREGRLPEGKNDPEFYR